MSDDEGAFDRLVKTEGTPSIPMGAGMTEASREWLVATGTDLETLVRMERVRQAHFERYMAVLRAMDTESRRKVLAGLYQEDGAAEYDDLEPWLEVGRRSLRHHVKELEAAGVVAVSDTRPAVVTWASEAMAVVVPDLLSRYYDTF